MMEAAPLLQREVSCFYCIIGIQYLICVRECQSISVRQSYHEVINIMLQLFVFYSTALL